MPVPAPANLVYLRWCFRLMSGGAAAEIAEFGLYSVREHTIGNTVDWDPDLNAIADKMAQRWITSFGVAPQIFSNAVALDHVDAYQIGPDGKAAHKGSVAAVGANAWVGTGNRGLPWQTALAVSTSAYDPASFEPNPRGKRGRFYLPPMAADDLSEDGRLTTGMQESIRVATGTFLNSVQGANYPGYDGVGDEDYVNLVIYSKYANKLARVVGVATPLTHFRVGRVVDTQRRRVNQLPEAYTSGTVDHA